MLFEEAGGGVEGEEAGGGAVEGRGGAERLWVLECMVSIHHPSTSPDFWRLGLSLTVPWQTGMRWSHVGFDA